MKTLEQVRIEAAETPEGKAFMAIGYSVEHQGGGCLAWQKSLCNGDYILITDSEGFSHTLGDRHAYDDNEPDTWSVKYHWVMGDEEYMDLSYGTDIESAVKIALAVEYAHVIGYDPFEDDPLTTVEEVAQTLREYEMEYRVNG